MGNFDHLSRFPRKDSFNHHFGYQNEKSLYSIMATEFINQNGVRIEYFVVSYDTQYDTLFGEDNDRRVERKFNMMTIFELPKEDEQWSMMDIEGLDDFPIFCTIKHFNAVSGELEKPRVGDFIKTRYNDFLYEIKSVDSGEIDNRFLQTDHIYELSVRKFVDNQVEDDGNLLEIGGTGIGDIFDTSELVDDLKNSTDSVPTTYPEDSGKGKPSPLYEPKIDEEPPNDPFGGF